MSINKNSHWEMFTDFAVLSQYSQTTTWLLLLEKGLNIMLLWSSSWIIKFIHCHWAVLGHLPFFFSFFFSTGLSHHNTLRNVKYSQKEEKTEANIRSHTSTCTSAGLWKGCLENKLPGIFFIDKQFPGVFFFISDEFKMWKCTNEKMIIMIHYFLHSLKPFLSISSSDCFTCFLTQGVQVPITSWNQRDRKNWELIVKWWNQGLLR